MKKTLSFLLALAMCLGLGTSVSAAEEPALPSLEVYLEPCENYEEGVADNAGYSLDDFLWASATVPLAGIDRALGYMTLLEEGPFRLALAQCVTFLKDGGQREESSCGALAYGPDADGFAAAFDFTGGGDPGLIPGAMAPVGGGRAVGVLVQPDEDAGTADIQLFCAAGFRFADRWEGVGGEEAASADRDGTLPDPYTFFNSQISYKLEEKADTQQNHVTFEMEGLSLAPADAYAALLSDPRYGLTVTEEKQGVTYGGYEYKLWRFDYTGEKEVGQVTFFGDDTPPCSLYIYCSAIQKTMINIRYAPGGFAFADYGDRYPEPLADAWSDPAGRGRVTGVVGADTSPVPDAAPATPAPTPAPTAAPATVVPTAAPVTPAPTPVSDTKSALQGLLGGGTAPVSDTKSALEGLLSP